MDDGKEFGLARHAHHPFLDILVNLLHRVHERRKALDADFQAVAGLNRSDPARCAGADDITRQERHVGRDETDQLIAIEDELVRVGILAQLPVLEQLDRQIMRVDLRFHVRPKWSERVKRLSARPLALAILNRAITDIL